jgi:hypothetical protein
VSLPTPCFSSSVWLSFHCALVYCSSFGRTGERSIGSIFLVCYILFYFSWICILLYFPLLWQLCMQF